MTSKASERIYYVSHVDGRVHCLCDVDHLVLAGALVAEIGKWCESEKALRVDEEVNLWTISEIAEFYK